MPWRGVFPRSPAAKERNESYGYATLGRLVAVGYITGLRDATYGRPPARYGRRQLFAVASYLR
jgi:hypothetical protein